jgi:tetratricopeptide (TPR) repeat protein
MVQAALAAGAFTASAASAAPNEMRTDRAALQALVSAELAQNDGDPRRALAEWQRLAVLMPELSSLSSVMLDQAIRAGDANAAQKQALAAWNSGDKSINARIVLLSGAIQRRDWKAADAYVSTHLDDGQKREWERMFGPILRGWIAAGRKDRRGISAAMSNGQSVPLHPALKAHEALMALSIGDRDHALALAANLTPTDRLSQLAALELAAELEATKQGLAAQDLRSRISLLKAAPHDPIFLLPKRRVNSPAAGVASWFAVMAESFNRISDVPSTLGEVLARSALNLDPHHWGVRLMLAEEYQSLNRPQDAVSLIGAKSPMPPVARFTRAESLYEQGDVAGAIQEVTLAVAGQDVPRTLLVMYAEFMRKAGSYEQAEEAFERLLDDLKRTGDEPVLEALLLTSLADLRLSRQSWEEVAPLIQRAVTLAPYSAAVLNFAGYSAIERRIDLQNSFKIIQKASELEPQNYDILDSLGWAKHLMGDHQEAVPLLEAAWAGEGSNAVIAEHLGDAYWIVGRRFEARNMWRAALLIGDEAMIKRLEPKLEHGLSVETAAP